MCICNIYIHLCTSIHIYIHEYVGRHSNIDILCMYYIPSVPSFRSTSFPLIYMCVYVCICVYISIQIGHEAYVYIIRTSLSIWKFMRERYTHNREGAKKSMDMGCLCVWGCDGGFLSIGRWLLCEWYLTYMWMICECVCSVTHMWMRVDLCVDGVWMSVIWWRLMCECEWYVNGCAPWLICEWELTYMWMICECVRYDDDSYVNMDDMWMGVDPYVNGAWMVREWVYRVAKTHRIP